MPPQPSPLSPEPLFRLGTAYWGAKAFLAACDFKLFTLLAAGPAAAPAVAAALGLAPRPARLLLNSLAAQGVLLREGELYRNAPLAAAFLVEGGPDYIGDFFTLLNRQFFAPFADLERTLRQDRPVWSTDEQGRHLPISGADRELFILGMHGLSAWTGRALGASGLLAGRRWLLDVGGGSGAVSIGAAQAHPELRAAVLERPAVCPLAQGCISRAGLSGRVAALPADIFADPYPPGPDVHLYSNIFHNFAAERGRQLIAKSFAALPPGGLLVIADYVLDDSGAAPEFAACFSLLALIVMEQGEARSFSEYRQWLADAGFVDIRPVSIPALASLVAAVKPAA